MILRNSMKLSLAISLALLTPAFSQTPVRPSVDSIATASGFGGYAGFAAPGSYVEIYGSNMAGTARGWASSDFTGTTAPTSLDGVTVTVNGTPAYISYVSPKQINIQIPDSIPTGTVPVVVTYQGLPSAAATLTLNAQQPGLLAPASFKVGSTQYVAAVHGVTGAFVSGGNIPGVTTAPAVSGETLIFYGTGFGAVTGTKVAGQIASGQTALVNPFTMSIGGSAAIVSYAGLAPSLVGVYQINAAVPANLAFGDQRVLTALNGIANNMQTLFLSVGPASNASVPAAPTIVSVTAGNTTAAIAFTGDSSSTQYTAICSTGGATKSGSGTASPIIVLGLTNGTPYACTVTATNATGAGAASAIASVTPSLSNSATYNTLWIPDTITGTTFNLTLKKTTSQLRTGAATNTYGFNGANFWGPTLIMNKGDVVQMNVTNQLTDSTTSHWHGFHIPPVTDGGPHQPIAPGETWTPSFEVKNNASTYWYHPHLHGKTAEQLLYGAGGFIIVKDATEAALALPRTYGIDDLPLVLTSRRFLSTNQFDLVTDISPYGDFLLTNGVMNAQVNLPAQFVRLRLLNAEVERGFNLGFSDDRTFYVIGNDGGLLDAPVAVTRAKLYVGERLELLVDLSKDAPGAQLDLKAFNGGQTFGFPGGEPAQSGIFGSQLNNKTFNVLHLNVTAATGNAITKLPVALVKNTYWTAGDATNKRTITVTDKGPGTPFNFDNSAYSMDTINQKVTLDAIEAWTITNNRTFDHSIHIHDVQFKIVSRSSGPLSSYEQGWKDTVQVPLNTSVTVVAKFEDFADVVNPYMYHCHFSNHEDEGMMGQFIVVKP